MAIDHEFIDQLMAKHLAELLEHVDAIQIIAVVRDGTTKDSHRLTKGGGCIYSRIGATSDWIEEQREEVRENVRARNRGDDGVSP